MADETPNPRTQPGTAAQMGPTIRGQIWPTYPRQSTNPQTWSVVKFYGCKLKATDADYPAVGSPITRKILFDIPITTLAWNSTVRISDGSGFPIGWDPKSCFDVKFSTVGGENITLDAFGGDSVCGTGAWPGMAWGGGWPFGPGTSLIVEITPQLAGLANGVLLEVQIIVPCLQVRMISSNYAKAIAQGAPGGGPDGGQV